MRKDKSPRKKVYVLAKDNHTQDFLSNQLLDILGEFVTISNRKHSLSSTKKTVSYDLIICAGEYSYNKARVLFPKTPILIAKRNLSLLNLQQLYSMPEGKIVLVVNSSQDSTNETIKSLIDKGLNHIKYIPYWGDTSMDTSEFDVAISPGMMRLCPKHISKKIDIGMREIALSTYVKILKLLNINYKLIDQIGLRYTQTLIKNYKLLAAERKRREAIKYNKQYIINKLNEGHIFIDKHKRISAVNSYAERILNIDKDSLSHKPLNALYKHIPQLEIIIGDEHTHDKVPFKLKNKKYLLSYLSLMKESGHNFLIRLQPAEDKFSNKSKIDIQKGKTAKYAATWTFDQIIGKSKSMHSVIKKGKLFSKTNSTVLITGESGTGKELIAQSIHNHSNRKKYPFIAVNFAALSDSLIDSELFGYESGAFTGAKKGGQKGLFEKANRGTIFLDEIGDAASHTQKRLLRVLQEKEIMRIGSAKRIPIDIKIIAATNRNLEKLIDHELFREDLYFRLKVCHVSLPPLRDRKEDILLLIDYFMKKHHIFKEFSIQAINSLLDYDWPGNVRELDNVVEYIANISQGTTIELSDLPRNIHLNTASHKIIESNGTTKPNILDLFNYEDLYFILETLYTFKVNNKSIGRQKLSALSKDKGLNLTESRIRTYIKYLQNERLLIIGKTRQGIIITNKGINFLNKLSLEFID